MKKFLISKGCELSPCIQNKVLCLLIVHVECMLAQKDPAGKFYVSFEKNDTSMYHVRWYIDYAYYAGDMELNPELSKKF